MQTRAVNTRARFVYVEGSQAAQGARVGEKEDEGRKH